MAASKQKIDALRKEYLHASLDEAAAGGDPFSLFARWFDEACERVAIEPNAMSLASVDARGRPSSRMVLLKHWDTHGLVFYSNYHSRKAQQLEANTCAALLFYWPELERQVRIEGAIEKTSAAESDAYFASRPRSTQLGAWVSEQSNAIATRLELEQRWQEFDGRFARSCVPRPEHWGGYRLKPDYFEFWQGREHKLHDRLEYRLGTGGWQRARLAP
jgi:pyridoxamine 5'-phosphate oxidase